MDALINKSKYHIPVLILICSVLFFWNIHVIPLTDGDSAFYAKIAKNIVETGDWLTMHYGDSYSIIDKPPLMMWTVAASFKLFGINEFALNFWHSLCALLIVLFTYKLAKEIYDEKTAFISAMVLATTAQFFYQARSPLQDIPLTLFILLSIYAFILFEKRSKAGYLYLSSIFVALAVLTKGPVGLVLPGIILLAYILIRKVKVPWATHAILAALLFLLITLPWFIIEYRILGQRFVDIFIGHNFGRYFKPIDTIGNEASKYAKRRPQYDFYSYFLQLFILAIPWSGYVYPAVIYNIRKKAHPLPLIFFTAVLLFFSFSLNYKISRYILPLFPALAIVTGKLLADAGDDPDAERWFRWSSLFTLPVILPLLVISTFILYFSYSKIGAYYAPLFLPFLILMCLCLLAGSLFGILKKRKQALISYAGISILSYLVLIGCLTVYYPKINPVSALCGRINSEAKTSDMVCQYKGTDAHFMIYYSKNNVILIRKEKEIRKLLLSDQKVYCVSEDEEAVGKLKSALKRKIHVLDKSSNFTLFTN
jgi:4-amino-4-deoxy-L-arabinose transferase-like glycosyltransferase